MFKHVPDGIYDHREFLTRYKIVAGKPTIVITKMWLDKGGPANVGRDLKLCWGTYPDIPRKH